MPIIRNPFRRNDDALRIDTLEKKNSSTTNISGAKGVEPPRSIDLKEAAEYKLSEINDSGVYLPPSPTERKNFWSTKSNSSNGSSNHRTMLSEAEPFNISRESFDSYRRSFDISARSPILQGEGRPRQSLDSRLAPGPPRHSSSFNRPLPPPAEDFEDVGLNDDPKPKKQSFLSRFTHGDDAKPASTGFLNRKRGQSGVGAELGDMRGSQSVEGGED